jgi:hypothetical protein
MPYLQALDVGIVSTTVGALVPVAYKACKWVVKAYRTLRKGTTVSFAYSDKDGADLRIRTKGKGS